mmetsp:Transcript_8926/g.21176  ORF Transcript_8926/g.21176 Transcript_8926/m.21176 type:complete len:285 (+) Transcript_8926:510-1364(+)
MPFRRKVLSKPASASCSVDGPKPTSDRYLETSWMPAFLSSITIESNFTRSGTNTSTTPSPLRFRTISTMASKRGWPSSGPSSRSRTMDTQCSIPPGMGTMTVFLGLFAPGAASRTKVVPSWTSSGISRLLASRRLGYFSSMSRSIMSETLLELAVAEEAIIWMGLLRYLRRTTSMMNLHTSSAAPSLSGPLTFVCPGESASTSSQMRVCTLLAKNMARVSLKRLASLCITRNSLSNSPGVQTRIAVSCRTASQRFARESSTLQAISCGTWGLNQQTLSDPPLST